MVAKRGAATYACMCLCPVASTLVTLGWKGEVGGRISLRMAKGKVAKILLLKKKKMQGGRQKRRKK